MRFWLMCLMLAPLLVVQARRARRDTPRLPEAGGADRGREGSDDGPPLRLLVVGESTAAGIGVAEHRQGLGAHLARALARHHQQRVDWQVIGVNGIRALGLHRHLAGRPPADALQFALKWLVT